MNKFRGKNLKPFPLMCKYVVAVFVHVLNYLFWRDEISIYTLYDRLLFRYSVFNAILYPPFWAKFEYQNINPVSSIILFYRKNTKVVISSSLLFTKNKFFLMVIVLIYSKSINIMSCWEKFKKIKIFLGTIPVIFIDVKLFWKNIFTSYQNWFSGLILR